jgi:DNA-directed RNA polymerase specialized sigma24 family protein
VSDLDADQVGPRAGSDGGHEPVDRVTCEVAEHEVVDDVGQRGGRVQPLPTDAAAQETLLRLYRSADTMRDEQALEAWMYRIADNAVIDHYRRSAHRPEPVSPDVVSAVPAAEDESRADALLASCLTPLVERLPDDYRTAADACCARR